MCLDTGFPVLLGGECNVEFFSLRVINSCKDDTCLSLLLELRRIQSFNARIVNFFKELNVEQKLDLLDVGFAGVYSALMTSKMLLASSPVSGHCMARRPNGPVVGVIM